MILVNLSDTLVKPLGKHLKPALKTDPTLYWRADMTVIGGTLCAVMQEQFTGYIMVICGLDNDAFTHFPTLFRDRFYREAATICKQTGVYEDQVLLEELPALFTEQHYQLDPQPQEENKITSVIEKLERRFLYEDDQLPCDGRTAFEFSFAINNRTPQSKQDRDTLNPAELMAVRCLHFIDVQLEAKESKPSTVITSSDNNIVHVDFAGQRKA